MFDTVSTTPEILMGKVKEERYGYKLIDMSPIFRTISYAPYLEMVNPSVGTIHLEGINPKCKTIDEALTWRNGTDKRPLVLT